MSLPPALSQDLSPTAQRIADAAVAVIAARGYEGLSVRSVAARAGLTGGAVQHHFPTRAALLEAAFKATAQGLAARVGAAAAGRGAKELLLELGEEALPLDERRRAEGIVWLVLSAASATDPGLAVLHRAAVRAVIDALTTVLADEPRLRSSPSSTARTFAAVLDGLTLQGVSGAQDAGSISSALRDCVDALWSP